MRDAFSAELATTFEIPDARSICSGSTASVGMAVWLIEPLLAMVRSVRGDDHAGPGQPMPGSR
jgi:hypothetical protein